MAVLASGGTAGDRPPREKLGRAWSRACSAVRLIEVRLRIPIVLAVAALVIGRWDVWRNYWDHFTRPARSGPRDLSAVSGNTEYFCPMDPGIVSNWPGRCGACNMELVRRERGEAVMLPSGVVARMRISPYRAQLAGIQTAPVEYARLERSWTATGVVARSGDGEAAALELEIPARQAPWIASGVAVEVACADLPGLGPLPAHAQTVTRALDQGREILRVTVAIERPPRELRAGMIASARFRVLAAELAPFRALPSGPPPARPDGPKRVYVCPDHPDSIALAAGRCALDGETLEARPLTDLERVEWWCPMHPDVRSERPGAVCQPCGGMALRPRSIAYAPPGKVLALPRSAVVDTGAHKVVFVESMPGTFDGLEVVLGPRCGDHYPVVSGLAPGQNVAIAGAFLLDAETRLDPSLASAYFGAQRRSLAANIARPASAGQAARSASEGPFAELSPDDRATAERQKICPVTGKKLGSMGAPVRLVVLGRTVFLCCEGCRARIERSPREHLAKLPAATAPASP